MASEITVKTIIAGVGVPDEYVDAAYEKALYWGNWVTDSGDVDLLNTSDPKKKLLVKALRGMLAEEVDADELDEVVSAVFSRILDWESWASPNDDFFWDYENVEPGRNEQF